MVKILGDFSRTLTGVAANTQLVKDDIQARVSQLRQQPGPDMLLVCGPELIAALAGLDLVDELLLIILPKALGNGQLLFGKLRRPMKLTLLSTHAFRSGGVFHHYRINNA